MQVPRHRSVLRRLVAIYTQTFVRFGLTAIMSPIILGVSCYQIISWVRNTPPEQLSDTWNIVYLPGTTQEQMEAFSRPQGWMTATISTVPLSVTFLTVCIFQTGHEFLCADTFVQLLTQQVFEQAKKLSEEKHIPNDVNFVENPSLHIAKLFSRTVKAQRTAQYPVLQDDLGNQIVYAKLTADSFNAFLSRAFNENSVAALPTIRAWMGAVLETISFTLWEVTVAIRRFRHSHSPGPDGITVSLLKAEANDIFPSMFR
ncbi:unnamed protein product [Dibothriocephalus latus]|uniref:Uncharacterized protein n=1 Tax=Dibothriocephalus latus TaxID=60516 RepID=A0A3P7PTD6_DIBLA|nr:unnamed protein product [Dibothriocephalus latus]